MSLEEQSAMQMILHGGNARALAFEALEKAQSHSFAEALAKLKEAEDELEKGHDVQTKLLQGEASGVKQPASLLIVHAMNHLAIAQAEKGLIAEIIELRKELYTLKR